MGDDDEAVGRPGSPEHDARQEEIMRQGASTAATETTTGAPEPDGAEDADQP
jgi:hypothetical protein